MDTFCKSTNIVFSYLCRITSEDCWRIRMESVCLRCSVVFNKSSLLLDLKNSFSLLRQFEAKSISTSSARTQFKLDGKRRKLDPNRPAPHTLRNRWIHLKHARPWLYLANGTQCHLKPFLILVKLQENLDLLGLSTHRNSCRSPGITFLKHDVASTKWHLLNAWFWSWTFFSFWGPFSPEVPFFSISDYSI